MAQLSKTYSKALFDIANSTNTLEKVLEDVSDIGQTIAHSAELKSLLKSPIIKSKDKMQVLSKIFSNVSPQTQKFLTFLCEKNREDALPEIISSFQKMCDVQNNVHRVSITSAVALSNDTLTRIEKYIKNLLQIDSATITNEVDASIIGGMVIKHEDKLLDLSVAKELRDIRKEIVYN